MLDAATAPEQPSEAGSRRAYRVSVASRWLSLLGMLWGYASILKAYVPELVAGTSTAPNVAVTVVLGVTALLLPLLGVAATVVPALVYNSLMRRAGA